MKKQLLLVLLILTSNTFAADAYFLSKGQFTGLEFKA
jgi:hypothetical protein